MALSLRKPTLAGLLGVLALSLAAPAQARDRYDDDGDDAALAIGAGVVGLALGAALASDRNDRYYYDDGNYYGGYYDRGYSRRYYRGYDRYPRHYRYNRNWRGHSWNDGGRYRRGDHGWRGHRGGWGGGWNGRWRGDRRGHGW